MPGFDLGLGFDPMSFLSFGAGGETAVGAHAAAGLGVSIDEHEPRRHRVGARDCFDEERLFRRHDHCPERRVLVSCEERVEPRILVEKKVVPTKEKLERIVLLDKTCKPDDPCKRKKKKRGQRGERRRERREEREERREDGCCRPPKPACCKPACKPDCCDPCCRPRPCCDGGGGGAAAAQSETFEFGGLITAGLGLGGGALLLYDVAPALAVTAGVVPSIAFPLPPGVPSVGLQFTTAVDASIPIGAVSVALNVQGLVGSGTAHVMALSGGLSTEILSFPLSAGLSVSPVTSLATSIPAGAAIFVVITGTIPAEISLIIGATVFISSAAAVAAPTIVSLCC